jgi:hypothetical protein
MDGQPVTGVNPASLVNRRVVAIGTAVVLAVGFPWWLLSSSPIELAETPPIPVSTLSLSRVGELDAALASPPFSPTRQPIPANGDPAQTAGVVAAAPPAPPPTPPQLVGLVVASRGKAVALIKAASGETVTLAPGQSVDGWKLVRVSREEAVVENGGARQQLRLDFNNRPAAGGSSPAQPPLPDLQTPPPLAAPLASGQPGN